MNMYKGQESVCSSKDKATGNLKTLNTLSARNSLKEVSGNSKFQESHVDLEARQVTKRRKQAKVPKLIGKTRKTLHQFQVKPNYIKKCHSPPSSKAKKQKSFKLAKKEAKENGKAKLRAVGRIVQFIEPFSACSGMRAFLIFQLLIILILLVYNFLFLSPK